MPRKTLIPPSVSPSTAPSVVWATGPPALKAGPAAAAAASAAAPPRTRRRSTLQARDASDIGRSPTNATRVGATLALCARLRSDSERCGARLRGQPAPHVAVGDQVG